MQPVRAKKIPKTLSIHGDQREDPYFWLRERENQEVIDHLKKENSYTDSVLAPTKDLQGRLFEEMKSRIKEDDAGVPFKHRDYFYYHRFEKGKEYPLYCRKKGSLEAEEEVYLDVNELAKGHDYFSVGSLDVSPNQQILAYAVDTQSRRIYTIYFKDLQTNETLEDKIVNVTGNTAWANDNKTLFYSKQDLQTLRSDKIYRFTLGGGESKLIFEEKDETFRASVARSRSDQYLCIVSSSTLTTEYRFLSAEDPQGDFEIFCPRERAHEYHVAHGGDCFYILSNKNAKNFRILKTQNSPSSYDQWEEVIPNRTEVYLENMSVFKDYVALEVYRNGLTEIEILDRASGEQHFIAMEEQSYGVQLGMNAEFDASSIRYHYESMTTPDSVLDYSVSDRKKELKKQKEVLGGFSKDDYTSERLWATAEDGTKVPISLVYKKGIKRDGKNPTLLYGYGSYGISMTPSFGITRLSLLNRGFVFAIAHIRGGSEMGRHWYESGKLLKKKNTFTDFIACSEFLIKEGFTDSNHLYAYGGSAGGLLMGAIVNMRPDLYKGMISAVPFVDVVTTMLDETIPLTTGEYDEWGNPNDKQYYEYIKSYSPYDNIAPKAYPNILVVTGLHDSQVQYWEPAKWVQRLRDEKTDSNLLLFHIDMDAGHSGTTGRYKSLKLTALEYAFLLFVEGIKD